MFGEVTESPQSETTDFCPCNPYAAAKTFAYHTIKSFRERYGTFACTGILYNHESPRRAPKFVTRKITRAAAAIKLGLATELRLGNLSASRDWGFAGDYVESMWRMLQQDRPSDFVIGTGKTTTVREFAQAAFAHVDLDYQEHIRKDSKLCRPVEKTPLVADPTLAMTKLSWRAHTTTLDLIRMMVDHDLKELKANGGDQLGAA